MVEYIKRFILKRHQTDEVFVTPSLRHCSNKYKLAREGEKDKDKDEVFFKFRIKSISVEETSFQLLLED